MAVDRPARGRRMAKRKKPQDSERELLQRLESWERIAAYLGRTVRTVQRWEREQQLPVRRHFHNQLSSVYAFVSELEAWRLERTRAGGDAHQAVQAAQPRDVRVVAFE